MTNERPIGAMLIVIVLVAAAVFGLGWFSDKETAKLRAECEARGGMLISARSGDACVGRPPHIDAPGKP